MTDHLTVDPARPAGCQHGAQLCLDCAAHLADCTRPCFQSWLLNLPAVAITAISTYAAVDAMAEDDEHFDALLWLARTIGAA